MVTEQFISEMAEVTGADFRGYNVEVGGTLHQENNLAGAQGATATFQKKPSKMRMGAIDLPDRVWLYDIKTQDKSFVPPTIAQKRMSDYPGRFTLKPQNFPQREPIDDTCIICARRRAQEGAGPKPFYSQFDLIAHYRALHTNEWDAIENDRRDKERREEQSGMRTLIASIAAMVAQNAGKSIPDEVRQQITGLQALPEAGELSCDQCGFVAKNAFGLNAHKRNKHKDGG